MATKPTRLQQQACDRLAEALCAIGGAFHLDGNGKLDANDLEQLGRLLGQVSSAFTLDHIVARALAIRATSLGLSSGTADLIALNSDTVDPLQAIRLGDVEFTDLVKQLEDELGGL